MKKKNWQADPWKPFPQKLRRTLWETEKKEADGEKCRGVGRRNESRAIWEKGESSEGQQSALGLSRQRRLLCVFVCVLWLTPIRQRSLLFVFRLSHWINVFEASH
jgi:hypothetical protein